MGGSLFSLIYLFFFFLSTMYVGKVKTKDPSFVSRAKRERKSENKDRARVRG